VAVVEVAVVEVAVVVEVVVGVGDGSGSPWAVTVTPMDSAIAVVAAEMPTILPTRVFTSAPLGQLSAAVCLPPPAAGNLIASATTPREFSIAS